MYTSRHRIADNAQALVRQLLRFRAEQEHQPTASTSPLPPGGKEREEEDGMLAAVRHVVLCAGLHESLEGVLPPPPVVAAAPVAAAVAAAMEVEG